MPKNSENPYAERMERKRDPAVDPDVELQGPDPTVDSPLRDVVTADALAHAFAYPDADAIAAAYSAADRLRADGANDAAAVLDALAQWMAADPRAAEERYTNLFDLAPVCTLHVGYHLFGEEYQRGVMLAGLRNELQRAGVEEGSELPDFLPTLVRLFARTSDETDRRLLAQVMIVPALRAMFDEFGDSDAPYIAVLRALPALLVPGAPDGTEAVSEAETTEFTRSETHAV